MKNLKKCNKLCYFCNCISENFTPAFAVEIPLPLGSGIIKYVIVGSVICLFSFLVDDGA